jgi:phosphatidyl-myo-inositol dimannoside synthase
VRTTHQILLVSAGLGLEGGGTALVGRLLTQAAAEYTAARGMRLRVLDLGSSAVGLSGLDVEHFASDRRALALAVLRRQLAGRPAAVVYDFLGPARIQALLPRFAQPPYLVFLHGVEVWRPLSWDRLRALANARFLLANSEHTRREATRHHPGLEVHVLPLALEERRPAGEPDGELLARLGRGYLLIVGRMAACERYKGHDELLAAMPAVLAVRPGAGLVVVGDGDDLARLRSRAAALGLADHVLFTGRVAEATLIEIYRRAAAFVMPSRGEGFGLVYLEAMREGKPCVAARGGAAEEVVVDGDTGLLVDLAPGNVEPLAGALCRLLGDPALAARLGENGRQRWRERFGAEAFSAGLAHHLDRLVERT